MAIFLFAGHNNADPGAVNKDGVKEADLTKELRNLILAKIEREYKVIKDNDDETLIQLIRRIKPGAGSVLLDIHFNAANFTASGVETLIADGVKQSSIAYQMARDLTATTATTLGIKNRGVKSESDSRRGRLGILHGAGERVLIEVGFITSSTDLLAYNRKKEQLATAIASTLMHYDNLIA